MIARPPESSDSGAPTGENESAPPPDLSRGGRSTRLLRGVGWARRPRWTTILAFILGAILGPAVLLTVQALSAPRAASIGPRISAAGGQDLVLTLQEPYLSALVQQRLAAVQGPVRLENPRIDVVPGERLVLIAEVPFMGQRFEASALMAVGVVDGLARLDAREVMLGSLVLPIDIDGLLTQPINRELAQMARDGQLDVVEVTTSDDRMMVRLSPRGPGPAR